MKLLTTLKPLILSLILVGGLSYIYAWTGPTQAPTGGNVATPVNIGSVGQTKTGYFGASEVLAATSTASAYCIGTSCINSWSSIGAGIPSGAVMAFDMDACPSGWTAYTVANGRQIIGVGNSGAAGSVSHTRGSTGGEEKHTQTINEMPSHNHNDSLNRTNSEGVGSYGGRVSVQSADSQAGDSPNTSYTGGGQAFNVMDPYIALLYCKKN